MAYDFRAIEARWQTHWEQQGTFLAPNPGDATFDPDAPKFYVLDMFPYPSGVGLHVGHPLGYIATDIVARYKRMRGFNVLHPMGFDAFGLPAEQFAVEHGVHPRITTEKNIANMVRQLRRLGLSYDWSRGVSTTDTAYYRWTQWIFLQLYHSYVDPATGRARPIAELEQKLASEELYVGVHGEVIVPITEGLDAIGGGPVGARKWHELSVEERAALLDEYRLAFLDEVPVNWCPALGTVLANEEVTADGRSERGNHPVYKRPLRQWMLRITAMADRLIDDLDVVDWPESIKLLQRNWIGRSEGAQVRFPLAFGTAQTDEEDIVVFTTRPDTLFGATYMVLAPEHPLVESITTAPQYHAVNAYRTQAAAKADVDRQAETRQKTGVFTGAYAINPVNNARLPIWIADYVMMGYGTGAIMAVPAHDQRDHDFAVAFNLPIIEVVQPPPGHEKDQGQAFTGHGTAINSANEEVTLDGLPTPEAKARITGWLASKGLGERRVHYKLRDWLFSRQRYWGEPFPILHGPDGQVVPVDEGELPVELPPMDDFRPTASDDPDAPPQPPLARAPDSWKYVERDGVRYTREFNTMPQWAGSCWYYLRFCDPRNGQRFVGEAAERYWMKGSGSREQGAGVRSQESAEAGSASSHAAASGGVDLYVGGVEHAVLHLLYARFWHKVLFDLGHVSTPEPFGRLFNQGYIQAHAYTDDRGLYVDAAAVEQKGDDYIYDGRPVRREFGKMGKSLKNAVAPDDVCDEYGCDTLRLYEMYMGPLDQSKVWNTRDIVGVHRFLQRVWRLVVSDDGSLRVTNDKAPDALRRLTHKTIKRVTDAMETMSFNVAIAALIELNNELVALPGVPREVATNLVLMLAPLAPHVAEELWSKLGYDESLAYAPWPTHDPAMLVADTVEYPVQVSGKLRGKVTVAADADDAAIEAAAKADPAVAAHLEGKTIRKVIVVKGKLINLVAT